MIMKKIIEFDINITSSDEFVDMPTTAQLLYFRLGMEADEEGLIRNQKAICRAYNASDSDLELLLEKGFVNQLEIEQAYE